MEGAMTVMRITHRVGAAVTFWACVWMLWNLLPDRVDRMLLVGALCLLAGLWLLKPAEIRRVLGLLLLATAALTLSLGLTLRFVVPALVQEVQRVQVETTERVKDTLVPSWLPWSRA
jgi:thiol:disulfide interchange protein